MTALTNHQWLLASRPQAEPTPANFRMLESPVPELRDGQVLVRHHYLSLDPYMRGRMNDAQELRRAAAARRGDDRRHRRRGGGLEEPAVQRRRPGRRPWAAGRSTRSSTPRSAARCTRSTPRHIPLSAYLGAGRHARRHGLVRPDADHRAQGRRDRGGERRHRRGRQRRRASWPRCAAAARSASPAGPRSAPTWSTNSASTPASTTSSTPI